MKKETEKQKKWKVKKQNKRKTVNSAFFLPTESIRNKKKTAY